MTWIKCLDRLPEEYDWVLAGRLGESGLIAYNIARYVNNEWEWLDSETNIIDAVLLGDCTVTILTDEITHWMKVDNHV